MAGDSRPWFRKCKHVQCPIERCTVPADQHQSCCGLYSGTNDDCICTAMVVTMIRPPRVPRSDYTDMPHDPDVSLG